LALPVKDEVGAAAARLVGSRLREPLDDFEQFGAVVAAPAAELDEFDRLGEQRAALGCAADADPVTGAQFE
jgi:hypothetical protein